MMILDSLLRNWMLIPIGASIATFASLIGIGGGLLWAPYLILVKGLGPQKAIMLSFLIQFVGMGSATFSSIKNKTIYWKLVLSLIPFIAVGSALGAFVNQRIAGARYIEIGLGVLSIIVSLFFAFQTEKYGAAMNLDRSVAPSWKLKFQSTFFGSLSGLFSVGIGDFLIPIMRTKLKIPMTYTIGSNLFLNFSLAFMGGMFHLFLTTQHIHSEILEILIFSWIGVIIGGQIGPKLSTMIGDNRLKETFIFALLLIGIHLIYQSM